VTVHSTFLHNPQWGDHLDEAEEGNCWVHCCGRLCCNDADNEADNDDSEVNPSVVYLQ